MTDKAKQARAKRIIRLQKKYGDSLKHVSENCRQQAIAWNKEKVPRAV